MYMSMAGGHGAAGGWGAVRSLSADKKVKKHQLTPGTIPRIIEFARPYRGRIAVFVTLILIEAGMGAMIPLVYRQIIDVGIADEAHRARRGARRRARAAGGARRRHLARRSAGSRRASARGSSTTCAPRCSTTCSASPSRSSPGPRPAPWCRGSTPTSSAPSRRSPRPCRTSSAAQRRSRRRCRDVLPVVADHADGARAASRCSSCPARGSRRSCPTITRERYQVDAAMAQTMTERFNVSGALLVKLFGRPAEESSTFAAPGRTGPRHRRHLRDVLARCS